MSNELSFDMFRHHYCQSIWRNWQNLEQDRDNQKPFFVWTTMQCISSYYYVHSSKTVWVRAYRQWLLPLTICSSDQRLQCVQPYTMYFAVELSKDLKIGINHSSFPLGAKLTTRTCIIIVHIWGFIMQLYRTRKFVMIHLWKLFCMCNNKLTEINMCATQL